MRKPFTRLYVHLVWSTWNRAPLLTPALLQAIDKCIRAECVKVGADVPAFGGVADHVHLLVRLPTTISVAVFVKQVKGLRLISRASGCTRHSSGRDDTVLSPSLLRTSLASAITC
ncbi:MAG TPA: transposase [Longimicrobium sp.]|nr:transposase [Longimicrobium sp.]